MDIFGPRDAVGVVGCKSVGDFKDWRFAETFIALDRIRDIDPSLLPIQCQISSLYISTITRISRCFVI